MPDIIKVDDDTIQFPPTEGAKITIAELIKRKTDLQNQITYLQSRCAEMDAQIQQAADLGVASAVAAVQASIRG